MKMQALKRLRKKRRAKYFLGSKSQVMKLLKNTLLQHDLVRSLKVVVATVFAVLFFEQELSAQELKAKFQDWSVFMAERTGQAVCYMASTPIKREGNYDKRGEPYFLVTNIPNDANEVSVSSGFLYKKKSDVEVSFGSKKYYLFPYLSVAWANDKNDDIDIIKEMQRAEEFVITGVTADGKVANDTYSLIGFAQGYAKMQEICFDPQ